MCNKAREIWWNWQNCPINLLTENAEISDIAMHFLEAGTPHDLEIFLVTAWSLV